MNKIQILFWLQWNRSISKETQAALLVGSSSHTHTHVRGHQGFTAVGFVSTAPPKREKENVDIENYPAAMMKSIEEMDSVMSR